MRMNQTVRKLLTLLAVLAMAAGTAAVRAEAPAEPVLTDMQLELGCRKTWRSTDTWSG